MRREVDTEAQLRNGTRIGNKISLAAATHTMLPAVRKIDNIGLVRSAPTCHLADNQRAEKSDFFVKFENH